LKVRTPHISDCTRSAGGRLNILKTGCMLYRKAKGLIRATSELQAHLHRNHPG